MKRKLALLLTAALAVSSLAACGSKEEAPADTSDAAVEETDDTAEVETTSDEGGVITYYGLSDWVDTEPYKQAYLDAKAQFEEENPGWTVELQSDPWNDWNTKYKTMFAAGDAADVFLVNNPDFPAFANSGNLLNLEGYVEDDYFDQFFSGVLEMYTWQGENQAIPFTTDCRVMWYNKEIFEEAGLDPETPPTTWVELAQYANQIAEKTDYYGFGMDLGLTEMPTQSMYCASDSSLLIVGDDGSITPNVDTDEFRAYLQTLVDMKDSYEPDYAVLTHQDVAQLYVEGQIGIIIGNALDETDILEKDWYGMALVPSYDGQTNGSYGGGFGIAVSSECENPEMAVKFAKILCQPEICAVGQTTLAPTEAGMQLSDMYSNSAYEVYIEQIQSARQAQPKTLFYTEIDTAVNEVVAKVLVDGMSVDDAVVEMENTINDIVSE